MPAWVERRRDSSAETNPRTHWGPLRRYGRTPPSTARGHNGEGRQLWCAKSNVLTLPVPPLERAVNARVRERVTARPIQPLRRLSLATVAERRGRPMARPVRPRPRTAGASPMLFRALCKEIPCPSRTPNPPHPSRGSRTEHEPEYAHAAESCPRWCRTARPQPCGCGETAPFTARRMS